MSDPISLAKARLAQLGLDPSAVIERFARASGPGGQNVNKVETGVSLTLGEHSVVSSDSRSQRRNREQAWERLVQRIVGAREEKRRERIDAREKERRRKRPRPRGVKERILEGKRKRSETKRNRSATFRD